MASAVLRRAWFGWRTTTAKTGAPAQTGYNKMTAANVFSIGYDEPLRAAPAATQFTATVNGVARTVSGVAVSGSKVNVTLAAPTIPQGATVVITYVANGTPAQNLADAAGAAAPNFVASIRA